MVSEIQVMHFRHISCCQTPEKPVGERTTHLQAANPYQPTSGMAEKRKDTMMQLSLLKAFKGYICLFSGITAWHTLGYHSYKNHMGCCRQTRNATEASPSGTQWLEWQAGTTAHHCGSCWPGGAVWAPVCCCQRSMGRKAPNCFYCREAEKRGRARGDTLHSDVHACVCKTGKPTSH